MCVCVCVCVCACVYVCSAYLDVMSIYMAESVIAGRVNLVGLLSTANKLNNFTMLMLVNVYFHTCITHLE